MPDFIAVLVGNVIDFIEAHVLRRVIHIEHQKAAVGIAGKLRAAVQVSRSVRYSVSSQAQRNAIRRSSVSLEQRIADDKATAALTEKRRLTCSSCYRAGKDAVADCNGASAV